MTPRTFKSILFRAVFSAAFVTALSSVARAADPEEAHYNVVVNLYNAGQWQAAISKIDEREKQSPGETMRARYLYARGLALEKGNRTSDARAAYQRLVETFPAAPETARALVAILYIDYAARDFEAVLKNAGRIDASKLQPADRQNLALMKAEALYALKKDAEALPAFDQAVALGASRAAIAPKLFEMYYRAGRYADVVALDVANLAGIATDRVAVVRAEAFMALNNAVKAQVEIEKIGAGSQDYPRASLIKAQILIKQGKLKEALEPLQTAVKELRDPPAPAGVHLALAECLMENEKPDEAAKAMARAEARAAESPEAERQAFAVQSALLKLRLAEKGGSSRALVKTVDAVQSNLPPAVLPEALYLRIHALYKDKEWGDLVRLVPADYPRLQGTAREGSATLLFAEALGHANQASNRLQLLKGYVGRKPNEPDALRARLALANAALETGDEVAARPQFKALLGASNGANILGTNAWREIARNAVALALKADDVAEAIAIARPLAGGPAADSRLLVMLGQAYTLNNQFPQAAATWKQALANAPENEAAGIRERLARATFGAGDFKGAIEQFQALAAGRGEDSLSRDLRELWARACFNLKNYTNAAARYQGLAAAHRDAPAYAYEAAVAFERAGEWAEAARAYTAAARTADKLPAAYAAAVAANVARARLEAGIDDRGAAFWLAGLAPSASNAVFEMAATMLGRCIAAGKPDVVAPVALEAAMKAYPTDSARRYSCGALFLQLLAARNDDRKLGETAALLADEFAANEKKLAPGASGATLAPAMIFYFRGDAARRAGDPAKALPDFETVLAAYPYNEWPDAAAYGAAECYAALGDLKTARAKLDELARSATANPGSAAWRERAKQRLTNLAKESSQ